MLLEPSNLRDLDALIIESTDRKLTIVNVEWKIIGSIKYGIVKYRFYRYYLDELTLKPMEISFNALTNN